VDLGPGISYQGSPALGDPTQAKAIVYIFSDFQCPVCRRAADEMHPEIPAMLAKGALVVFKNNALEMHKNARPAALAAMAAHAQGKFWVFHDKLFANSANLSPELFQGAARDLGLDLARFEADLKARAVAEQVDREGKLARDLDAQGTPSYFVNGKKQVGWGSAFGLKAWVEQEIAAVDKLITGGMTREAAIQARVKQNAGDKAMLLMGGSVTPP
jgi:protein-disulfide isomerase